MPSQTDIRTKKLAGLRAELAGLRAQFEKTRQDVAQAVKRASKRRDDWLLEHTR
ncbi:MAG: hypothetical protein RL272_792, partial [Candidatus Parcubacteria bacterium]